MMDDLNPFLNSLYSRYNSKQFLDSDPVKWVHRFEKPIHIELSAFLSSVFAFGRVDQIHLVLAKLFEVMGPDPFSFLIEKSELEINQSVSGIYYRFYTSQDIGSLLGFLKWHYTESDSLEKLFLIENGQISGNPLFEKWSFYLLSRKAETFGTKYMMPDPKKRSASKRMMMFLRWMVRKDEIDLGIWKTISPDQLLIPMDTHLSRICFYLGLSNQSSATFKNSVTVTQNLKHFAPDDPVKYDFAISRLGILNECPKKRDYYKCQSCMLITVCSR